MPSCVSAQNVLRITEGMDYTPHARWDSIDKINYATREKNSYREQINKQEHLNV